MTDAELDRLAKKHIYTTRCGCGSRRVSFELRGGYRCWRCNPGPGMPESLRGVT